jgi:hypothetical protein
MEPRPPRPRQQYLPQDADRPGGAPAGSYQRGGIEQGMYAPPPGYAAGPPPYPNELDLVPRRARHRQRIARNILITLVVLIAIGAAAWNVRDRFFTSPPDQNLAQLALTPDPGVPAANPDASTPTAAQDDGAPTQAPLINNLLATSTPTPEDSAPSREIASDDAETAAPTAAPAAQTDDEPDAAPPPADLASLLPEATELPVNGLTLLDSGVRPLEAVLASFGADPAVQAEAQAFLEEWGWTENVYSDFVAADPSLLAPDATTVVTVSIHGFASQAAASDALTYFSNVVVSGQGFDEVQADPIGDEIRLLRGVSEDGTTNVAAYIVDGPLLYRIGGSSPAGDPTIPVLQLAEQLINGS